MLYTKEVNNLHVFRISFIALLLILASLPLQFSVCRNLQLKNPSLIAGIAVESNISEWLQSDDELSLFSDALNKTELLSGINSTGIYLVFAPTNKALQEEGSAFLFEEILSADEIREKLLVALKMHIVENPSSPLDISDYPASIKTLMTLSGRKISFKRLSSKILVGRNTLVTKIVHTVNGTVFYTDSLLQDNAAHVGRKT